MSGTFHEVVEPERLVFTAVAEDKDGNPLLEAHTTVIFEDRGDKTKLTVQANVVGLRRSRRRCWREWKPLVTEPGETC